MVFQLGMMLSVFLMKKIVFYEKNLRVTKYNTFNNVFFNRIFPSIVLTNLCKNYGLFFQENYSLKIFCFDFRK